MVYIVSKTEPLADDPPSKQTILPLAHHGPPVHKILGMTHGPPHMQAAGTREKMMLASRLICSDFLCEKITL